MESPGSDAGVPAALLRDLGALLDHAVGARAVPRSITVDHGTEFMSRALEDWAYQPTRVSRFVRKIVRGPNGQEQRPFVDGPRTRGYIPSWIPIARLDTSREPMMLSHPAPSADARSASFKVRDPSKKGTSALDWALPSRQPFRPRMVNWH